MELTQLSYHFCENTKFSYKFCARFNIENIGLWDFSGFLQVESHVTIHFSFIGME